MRWKRDLFTLGGASVGFAVLAVFWMSVSKPVAEAVPQEAKKVAAVATPFVTIVDPAKGPKDAPVTIVEYGDHACPYCKSMQDAVDSLIATHPDSVRFVWKSAPSPSHPSSTTAAQAALCANRQGRFWEYHDRLFEDPTLLNEAAMVILANELELDSAAFSECLSTDATLPLVERTVTEAQGLGLTGIPTVFINDRRYEGAMTYDQLLEATGL